MERNYSSILSEYGFDHIPEPENTTLAFYHEIQNTLFEEDSPFDSDASILIDLPDIPEHMIQCSLELTANKSIFTGVSYLMDKWYKNLRYKETRYEQIQRSSTLFGEEIHIIAVTDSSVCTFLFTIVDEDARSKRNSYINGYDAVDNPDEIIDCLLEK